MPKNFMSHYASSRRSDSSTIERQKKLLTEYYDSIKKFYDAISETILIVNSDRQIVFFNSVAPSLLGIDNPESIYGLRPGEALGCVYACENPGGCGTSEFCSQCGAVNAIILALSNKADLQECRVFKKDNIEALDLLVRTTPLEIKGQLFSIMAITDISHEKRRSVLEHIFFHDIMNTAASINMFAKMLDANPNGINATYIRQNLLTGLNQLINEISSQKELLAAENNELVVEMQPVDGYLLVRDVVELLKNRFRDHKVVVYPPVGKVIFNTDRRLLHRILENMIINAIEASKPEDIISISCGIKEGYAEFQVHNKCHIQKKIQLQLFQRSFSTKGVGRGLGTYSMKLLSERYLNGSICLNSSPQNGTTFVARYPL
ncbi:MAG: HAMP domain-containing histidine kinase [Actinobacteria bacterium]|nr:HAMP domain-containing histidine kinase [Actinomycetota bacterium]